MTDGYFDKLLNSTRAIYTGIALIFVATIVWYFFSRPSFIPNSPDPAAESSRTDNTAVSRQQVQSSVDHESAPDQSSRQKAIAQPSEIELRIVASKNDMFRTSVSKLVSRSEVVAIDAASLLSQIMDMETNEFGRKIAIDSTSVKSFVSYRELAKKLDEQLSGVLAEIKLYDLEIQRAMETHPEQAIPDSLKAALRKLESSIDDIAKSVATSRIGLEALLNSDLPSQPSESSLADSIKNLETEDRKRMADAQNAKRAKELQARADEVAKAEHEMKLAAIDAEKVRIKNEQLAIEARKEADAIEAERKRNLMLLDADFQRELPQINHYLGPLFKSSTKQPLGTGTKEEKASGPVSLSALMASGVGNPDIRKACGSLLLFFSNTDAGGRGKGPYEALYYGAALTDEQLNRVRPAYNLLDKYGLLLVEKGMLAK